MTLQYAEQERHAGTSDPDRHDTPEADTVIKVTGKSGRGTARQTIRMDEDLWEKLDGVAKELDTDRSALLREYARWAIRDRGARAPRRGSAGKPGDKEAAPQP